MAVFVTLKNRLPEIQAKLASPELQAVLHAATEPIAEAARSRAPVATGRLRESIEVSNEPEGSVGVKMAWYGRFVEHGTVKAPAHPFLVPAAEAGKNVVADAVTAWLRSL